MQNILKNFFPKLSEDELTHILCCIDNRLVKLKKDSVLNLQDGMVVGLVLKGAIDKTGIDIDGKKTIERRYLKDDIFAFDMNLMTGSVFITYRDSEIFLLRAENIYDEKNSKCKVKTLFMENLIRYLNEELSYMSFKTKIYSQKSLRDKIMYYLLHESESCGTKKIKLPFNRDDFAAFLNCNRSALSRELSRMEDEGILRLSKNWIELI